MIAHARRTRSVFVASIAVATLVLTACGDDSNTKTAAVPTLTGDCAKYQAYAGYANKTVTMYASIQSPESDSLQKSWSEFSKCTGIKISYEGANDFESQFPVRVTRGHRPRYRDHPATRAAPADGEERQGGEAEQKAVAANVKSTGTRHGRRTGRSTARSTPRL